MKKLYLDFKKNGNSTMLIESLAQTTIILSSFLATKIIIDLLNLTVYGVYIMLGVTINLLISVITENGGLTVMKFVTNTSNKKDQFGFIILGLCCDILYSFLFTIIIWMFTPKIIQLIFDSNLEYSTLHYYAIVAGLRLMRTTPSAILFIKKKYSKYYSLMQMVEPITFLVLISLQLNDLDHLLQKLCLAALMSFISTYTIFYVLLQKEGLLRPPNFSKKSNISFVKHMGLVWSARTLKSVNKQLDVFLVGVLLGSKDAGVLDVMKKFIKPLLIIKKPFELHVYPKVYEYVNQEKWSELRVVLKKNTIRILLLSVIYVGSVLLVSPIIADYYSLRATDFKIYFPLLALANVIMLMYWWSPSINGALDARLSLKSSGLNTLMSLSVLTVFLYYFGLLGLLIGGIAIKLVLAHFWQKVLTNVVVKKNNI
ncbi:hypothetical protein N8Z92_04530 [Schleiferiaceae bacterium]|nr:hypothetical protein [Schleiferiaceae bacterium]